MENCNDFAKINGCLELDRPRHSKKLDFKIPLAEVAFGLLVGQFGKKVTAISLVIGGICNIFAILEFENDP